MAIMEGSTVNLGPAAEKTRSGGLPEAARKIGLFTLGVAATAIEDGYHLFSRLIENREAAEQEGRKLVHQVMNRRKQNAHKAEDEVAKPALTVKNRGPISTKADIAILDEQITRLVNEIDALGKS